MPSQDTPTDRHVAFEFTLKDGTGFAALGSLHDALDEQPGIDARVRVHNETVMADLRCEAQDPVGAALLAVTALHEVLGKVGWSGSVRRLKMDTSQAT